MPLIITLMPLLPLYFDYFRFSLMTFISSRHDAAATYIAAFFFIEAPF